MFGRFIRSWFFALPWLYVIGARQRLLRWGATEEEAHRSLPGDELLLHPTLEATRALTVWATPEQIWPWLVQMGYRRAGWYSYDFIDNGGLPSADSLVPAYQDLRVGDVMPLGDGAGFRVAALDPPSTMVLEVPDTRVGPVSGSVAVTLALDPQADGSTRLVTRLRAEFGSNLASTLYYLVFEPGDFVMMRKMLLGIKERAERTPAPFAKAV